MCDNVVGVSDVSLPGCELGSNHKHEFSGFDSSLSHPLSNSVSSSNPLPCVQEFQQEQCQQSLALKPENPAEKRPFRDSAADHVLCQEVRFGGRTSEAGRNSPCFLDQDHDRDPSGGDLPGSWYGAPPKEQQDRVQQDGHPVEQGKQEERPVAAVCDGAPQHVDHLQRDDPTAPEGCPQEDPDDDQAGRTRSGGLRGAQQSLLQRHSSSTAPVLSMGLSYRQGRAMRLPSGSSGVLVGTAGRTNGGGPSSCQGGHCRHKGGKNQGYKVEKMVQPAPASNESEAASSKSATSSQLAETNQMLHQLMAMMGTLKEEVDVLKEDLPRKKADQKHLAKEQSESTLGSFDMIQPQ